MAQMRKVAFGENVGLAAAGARRQDHRRLPRDDGALLLRRQRPGGTGIVGADAHGNRRVMNDCRKSADAVYVRET